MTLKEFVSHTLTEIVEGVTEARQNNSGIAPSVAAREKGSGHIVKPRGVTDSSAFLVEFDVAVTTSQKTGTEGGGGLQIHVVSAGATRSSEDEHSTVSRIKFPVPITYDEPVAPFG